MGEGVGFNYLQEKERIGAKSLRSQAFYVFAPRCVGMTGMRYSILNFVKSSLWIRWYGLATRNLCRCVFADYWTAFKIWHVVEQNYSDLATIRSLGIQ